MKPVNKSYRFYQKYLSNKYFLSFVIFSIWVIFIDSNNLVDRFKAVSHINKLERQKEYYKTRITQDQEKLNELRSDKSKLEKFAREQYLMKKENEDIFIILVDDN